MSDVERVPEPDWHDKTLTEFQRGYLKGERDARMALGPQLTPEQARRIGRHYRPSPYRGYAEDRAALRLIAERGGTDG